jgi:glycosyltransferase involved in cell wall biosynthesis
MAYKILFCGTNVPDTIEYKVKNISAAGNRFQNNMVANLRSLSYQIKNISFIGVPLSEVILTELESENQSGDYIGYPKKGIASVWRFHRLLKKEINDSEIVMCYNIIYAWLLLPFICSRKKKKSCVILADYSGVESYTGVFRKIYARMQLWSLQKYDLVVGLSVNIQGKLKINQKFILMEGGIDDTFYQYFLKPKDRDQKKPIVIMYSGLLSKVTGVDLLLEAITKTNYKNVRFVITGKGELEELIQIAAQKDDRIDFKGHLSYEKYMEELQNSDILINPRNMDFPENQNNFPSKIIDYLAAGKVILSTRFAGWKKYRDNIFFCDSTSEILAMNIEYLVTINNQICSKTYEANRKTAAGFEWKTQIRKLLEG